MTSASDRAIIIKLVDEAVQSGARQSKACEELGLTTRTLQRWLHPNAPSADKRPSAARTAPKHKLTDAEEAQIIATVNQTEFASKPPGQIVPILADQAYTWPQSPVFTEYCVVMDSKTIVAKCESQQTIPEPVTAQRPAIKCGHGISPTFLVR